MTGAGPALRLLTCALGVAAAVAITPAAPALAQGLAFGHSDQPVEILADQNIEWQREQQRYIARGNASAKQGDTTVYADVLTAYYRPQPKPDGQIADAKDPKPGPANDPKAEGTASSKTGEDSQGGTQIFRYEAEGHVRIVTPTDTAVGDKGIYDIDTGVLVLTGHGLKLTTPNETITSRDSLEYWQEKQMAVARGDAVVVTQDKRMTGDLLTAYFVDNKSNPPPPTARNVKAGTQKPPGGKATKVADKSGGDAQGGNRLQRIEGFGHVHVSTPTEIVTADRGVYNADTGIAMMSDNVRITRGDNQLNGDFAEVNLNTGISRLLTRGNAQQVRGLFIPQQKQDKEAASGEKTPAANEKKTDKAPSTNSKPGNNKPDNTKKANP